jgi:hypothetical protein
MRWGRAEEPKPYKGRGKILPAKAANLSVVILGLVPRICKCLIFIDVVRSSGQARG